MSVVHIYCLRDPDTKEVRYIGKAKNLDKRLEAHLCRSSLRPVTRKNGWIKSLLANGKTPLIESLLEVPSNDWAEEEQAMIAFFTSAQARLTNGTLGGDGGVVPSTVGVPRSSEVRSRISASQKGHTVTAATRNKIATKLRGRRPGEETRKRLSESHRRAWKAMPAATKFTRGLKISKAKSKGVCQYTKDGTLVSTFRNARAAAKETEIGYKQISRVCLGQRKSAGGFNWKFENDKVFSKNA